MDNRDDKEESVFNSADCDTRRAADEKENNVPQPGGKLERPPYSFISLIAMAILQAPGQKLTLSGICDFIAARFPYYGNSNTKWRATIRHNLSLNECFVNVKRNQSSPGKGNYWRMSEDSEGMFVHGTVRRRRTRAIKPGCKSALRTKRSSTSSLRPLSQGSLSNHTSSQLIHPSSTSLAFPCQNHHFWNIQNTLIIPPQIVAPSVQTLPFKSFMIEDILRDDKPAYHHGVVSSSCSSVSPFTSNNNRISKPNGSKRTSFMMKDLLEKDDSD